jgi:hypothetical protein
MRRTLREACRRRDEWPPRAGTALEEEASDHLRRVFVRFLRVHRADRIGPSGMSQKQILECITVEESVGGQEGIRDVATRGTMVEGLVSIVPFALIVPIRIDHYEDRRMQRLEFTCDFFRACAYSPVHACAHLAFCGNHYMAVCHPRGLAPSFEPPRMSLYVRRLTNTTGTQPLKSIEYDASQIAARTSATSAVIESNGT